MMVCVSQPLKLPRKRISSSQGPINRVTNRAAMTQINMMASLGAFCQRIIRCWGSNCQANEPIKMPKKIGLIVAGLFLLYFAAALPGVAAAHPIVNGTLHEFGEVVDYDMTFPVAVGEDGEATRRRVRRDELAGLPIEPAVLDEVVECAGVDVTTWVDDPGEAPDPTHDAPQWPTDPLGRHRRALESGAAMVRDAIAGASAPAEPGSGPMPHARVEASEADLRAAAEELGYSHMDIVSGAGHDACWINDVAPTAMIMCPCVDGLSHNEAEEITKEWAQAGTDVLLHAVLNTAEIVE